MLNLLTFIFVTKKKSLKTDISIKKRERRRINRKLMLSDFLTMKRKGRRIKKRNKQRAREIERKQLKKNE